ncbi:MAG TPA: N-acetyltransferase [Candidatus Dormibacteraeota bacterium]|nr:N-acetyltransferase [Candidatus Dormibacteraeota bacterium]
MRPGRAGDLPALVELWRSEVRAGRRDSVPREVELQKLLAHFDWGSRSRLVDNGATGLAGAVVVTSRPSPEGTLARIDPAAAGENSARVMRELVQWGVWLSRAAGAAAAQVWVGPGYADVLRELDLVLARPWWRMDRTLDGDLPTPVPVGGYELLDGSRRAQGSWAEMHNRSFADHWRFSARSEEELMFGKAPELCLMAVTATTGEPAAVTLCHVETYAEDTRPQPVGLVSSVGTLPEYRRRGLARWLVAEGMLRLRKAGARHASLYVDGLNQTRAFDAYRKLGFELAFEAEVWEATFP